MLALVLLCASVLSLGPTRPLWETYQAAHAEELSARALLPDIVETQKNGLL
jgi:hypothetical protein